jgi:hypothetical protein
MTGPAERGRLGDRDESQIAFREPLAIEPKGVVNATRNVGDWTPEQLNQAVSNIVAEHLPIVGSRSPAGVDRGARVLTNDARHGVGKG